jgi:hypothetical protein
MASEPLERLWVEINALMQPFVDQFRQGLDEAASEAGKSAEEIERIFMKKFLSAFKKDMEGFAPDLQKFMEQAFQRMELKDLGFREALSEEFNLVAKEGKVLNMTLKEITEEVGRLTDLMVQQAEEAFPAVIEKIKEHKQLTDEDTEGIRQRLIELRLASDGTVDFRKKLDEFMKSELDVEKSAKKKTRAIKDQTKEVKRDQKAMSNMGKTATRLIKRFASMFIGIYALRRAFNALSRTIQESIALYMETVDETGALVNVMSNLDKQTQRAQLQIGRLATPFNILGKAIKAIGMQLFAILLERVIKISLQLVETIIIMVHHYKNFKSIIELAALTIKKTFVGAFLIFLEVAKGILKAIKPITDFLGGALARAADGAAKAIDNMQQSIAESTDSWKTQEQILQDMEDEYRQAAKSINELRAAWANLTDLAEETSLEKLIASRLKKAFDDILKAADESRRKAEDALEKRLDDIGRRMGLRRADAQRDLARDLVDIEKDAYEDRVKASVDFQERQFRLTEDFKLKMLELEERFLFDLEDAVRERDARGVLMLQRKFNLEKAQLERTKNIRTKRLKEDFKNELVEIEREREIRKLERLDEYEEQLADLREQEDRLREEARIQFDRRMTEISDQINSKLNLLVEGFSAELRLTRQELLLVYEEYLAAYGPDGYITAVYKYWQSVLASGVSQPTVGGGGGGGGARAFQRGGSFIATSPTLISVGEGQSERVDITPFSQASGRPRGGFRGGGLEGGEGRVEVDVNLGEGLVGEIVDETMDQVADVIVRVNRK